MQITLNGEPYIVEDAISLGDLLNKLKLKGRLAVEINQQIIPHSDYSTHIICADDKVEIVYAIGGG